MEELKIQHNSWYCAVTEGHATVYPETQGKAHALAKSRGYHFDHIEKTTDGYVVEIWIKKSPSRN